MFANFVSNILFCGIFALAAVNHIMHFEEELPKLVKAGIPAEYAPICLGFALAMMVLGTLLIITVKFEKYGLLQYIFKSLQFPSNVRASPIGNLTINHESTSFESILFIAVYSGYFCYVMFLVPVTYFMHALPWIEAMKDSSEKSEETVKIQMIQTLKNISLIGACFKLMIASSGGKSSSSKRNSKKSKKKRH